MYERTNLLASHHFLQITHDIHVEDIDGQMIVIAHADSSQIHHLQTTCQHLLISNIMELRSRRILLRVSRIDTIRP